MEGMDDTPYFEMATDLRRGEEREELTYVGYKPKASPTTRE